MSIISFTRAAAAALAIGAVGLAVPAFAHHSNAMFDYTKGKERELKGTVNQFLWTNPHGYLEMAVTTSSGKIQKWTVEFQGLQGMASRGLTIDSFKPGDEVTVIIHPLRNGTTGGDFYSAVLSDGSEIVPPKEQ
ncbi:hypothetical protein XM25_14045 [Devosia sp. H5989]|nr:hypothetical protein XM25_14045 [Devosia sp. H5989]